jgi:hypothetical protein
VHAVLCELIPGGFGKVITAGQAARVLDTIVSSGAIARAYYEFVWQFLDDLRGLDTQLREIKKKLAAVVRQAGPH